MARWHIVNKSLCIRTSLQITRQIANKLPDDGGRSYLDARYSTGTVGSFFFACNHDVFGRERTVDSYAFGSGLVIY